MHSSYRYIFFFVFILSGCSGLVYESIWSHYLGLFLGRSAFAHSITLATFMGGMALGAWVISKYIHRLSSALFYYAICEAILGLLGFIFHPAFVSATSISYDSIIPALSNPSLVNTYKWLLSAALILPQSILLGATFPLLSSSLIRRQPKKTGAAISTLYASNSFGAVIGALAATFILLPTLGMYGTLHIAGAANLLIALFCFILHKTLSEESRPPPFLTKNKKHSNLLRVILITSAASGAASFIYEIAWIRMLNLVLGTTLHSFELMLSAFILGLALGGLWIRKRIDHLESPLRFAAYAQICMGAAALLTLPLYMKSFDWVAATLKSALQKTDLGYDLYNVLSSLTALVIMLPATFFAGMTLPLFTAALLKKHYNEEVIGKVYAANTLGAILGVAFASHIGITVFGLKYLVVFAACLDALLGFFILFFLVKNKASQFKQTPVFLFSLLLVLVSLQVDFNPEKLSAGTFRYQRAEINKNSEILFYKDGKTATISVLESPGPLRIISTNGKPDAGVIMSDKGYSPDEATMLLAAAIPMLLKPNAEYVANIGFGSGLTSHALLGSRKIKRLDSIEIEPAIIEGARLFKPRNNRAYEDPRSNIVNADAKSFFAAQRLKYDYIVSEPSNPWVAGVGNLFTTEFYTQIKKHIKSDGLLLQWLQLYEISPSTITSAFKALDENFDNYSLFLANGADLLIVASMGGEELNFAPMNSIPKLQFELERLGINNTTQLESRIAANKKTLSPMLTTQSQVQTNSDYFPVLSLSAPKDRFKSSNSKHLINPSNSGIPYKHLLSKNPHYTLSSLDRLHPYSLNYSRAIAYINAIRTPSLQVEMPSISDIGELSILQRPNDYCGKGDELEDIWLGLMLDTAKQIHPTLELEKRLIFSKANFQAACSDNASPKGQQAIKLQASVAENKLNDIYWQALELLDSPPQSRHDGKIKNYALNHFLYASLMLNKQQDAANYIDRNRKKLSPNAGTTTRWLQAIIEFSL